MQKIILTVSLLAFATVVNTGVFAQTAEKQPVSAADAWRQALPPETQQVQDSPSAVVTGESRDNVEAEETPKQIEQRILKLEQRLMEATKQRDPVALKHLLADDFMPAGANIAGSLTDKTRYINWALKDLQLKSYVFDKAAVRVYKTTAVTTVYYKQQATVAGQPTDGDFIATNVWVKRGKLWQAVSHHVSQLPKP